MVRTKAGLTSALYLPVTEFHSAATAGQAPKASSPLPGPASTSPQASETCPNTPFRAQGLSLALRWGVGCVWGPSPVLTQEVSGDEHQGAHDK